MPFGALDQPLPASVAIIGGIAPGSSSFADIAIPNLAQPMTKLRLASGIFAAAIGYQAASPNVEIAVTAQLLLSGSPRWTGRILTNVPDVQSGNTMALNIVSPIDLINPIDVRSGQTLTVRCTVFNYSSNPLSNVAFQLGQNALSLGSSTPAYASSATGNTLGAAALTIPKPAGTVQNDLLVGWVSVHDTITGLTPPAGWTFLDYATLSGVVGIAYYKVAGAVEPANYAFTLAPAADSAGVIDRFTGIDPAAPINTENIANGGGGSVTTNSITTTRPCVIAEYLASGGNNAFPQWTPPGNVTLNTSVSGGNPPSAMAAASARDMVQQAAPGDTGTRAFTFNANQNQVAAVVAVAGTAAGVSAQPVNSGLTYQELRWNE